MNGIKHGEPRTDALRPSVFDPADFEIFAWFDLKEFEDGGFHNEMLEWEHELIDAFGLARVCRSMDLLQTDVAWPTEAELGAVNPLWVCDHCGASNLRNIAAVRQTSTGDVFVFGSRCVERAGLPNRAELDLVNLKRERANRKLRALMREKQGHYLNEHPDVRAFILNIKRGVNGEPVDSFDFVNKMDLALNKYGELTERQAAAVLKIAAKRAEADAEGKTIEQKIAEREAAKGPAPVGRQTVRGEIVKVKSQEGYFPDQTVFKMVVRLENGSAVWVTIPRALEDRYYTWARAQDDAYYAANKVWAEQVRVHFNEKIARQAEQTEDADRFKAAFGSMNLAEIIKYVGEEVAPAPERASTTLRDFLEGRRIELTATFEVSDRDEHFSFGKRPIARFVEEEE